MRLCHPAERRQRRIPVQHHAAAAIDLQVHKSRAEHPVIEPVDEYIAQLRLWRYGGDPCALDHKRVPPPHLVTVENLRCQKGLHQAIPRARVRAPSSAEPPGAERALAIGSGRYGA